MEGKRQRIVLIDFDNTIAKVDYALVEAYEQQIQPKKSLDMEKRFFPLESNYQKKTRKKLFEIIRKVRIFYYNMEGIYLLNRCISKLEFLQRVEAYDGAFRAIKEMRSLGFDVRILTDMNDDYGSVGRLRWLNQSELLLGWELRTICTKDKTIIKVIYKFCDKREDCLTHWQADFLIDDDPNPEASGYCKPDWTHIGECCQFIA